MLEEKQSLDSQSPKRIKYTYSIQKNVKVIALGYDLHVLL